MSRGHTPSTGAPEFRKHYEQLQEIPAPRIEVQAETRRMSISAEKMPLSSFLRYVSDRTGVSVIAENNLDDKEVTLDMKDQDVGLVLSVVARRLGVQVTRSGNLYYLGKLRNEDRGVLVRKVRRLDDEDLNAAVSVLLSDNGRAETYADGLVVIGDRVEVLERVTELLDGIESAPSNSWIVQLHLVSLADTFFVDAGLDVSPAADISATFAMIDVGDSSGMLAANASLRAVLSADRQDDSVTIVTEPSFVLLDGSESTFRDATQTPVRIRTVSPEGTVTDAGFETVQTGTEITVGIRELGANRARLFLEISSATVAGAVENIPIVDEQTYSTEASVRANGVYMLGSFRRAREANQARGITATARRQERDSRTLYVWARTYRIAAPIDGSMASTTLLPPIPPPSSSTSSHLPGVDDGGGGISPPLDSETEGYGEVPEQEPSTSRTDDLIDWFGGAAAAPPTQDEGGESHEFWGGPLFLDAGPVTPDAVKDW